MSRAPDVRAGLLKHKRTLLRELATTDVLDVLVKKGLLSLADHEAISGERDAEHKCAGFVDAVSKLGAARASELCAVLESECPELTRQLLRTRDIILTNGYYSDNTKDSMVMDYNLNRESPRSRRSVSQCSCGSAAVSRPPSRRSSLASPPPPQLNNTVEEYVEPVVEDDVSSARHFRRPYMRWDNLHNVSIFLTFLVPAGRATW